MSSGLPPPEEEAGWEGLSGLLKIAVCFCLFLFKLQKMACVAHAQLQTHIWSPGNPGRPCQPAAHPGVTVLLF